MLWLALDVALVSLAMPKSAKSRSGRVGLIWSQADEEVGGLDILVNDLLVMGVLQRIGGLLQQGCHLDRREQCRAASLPQPVREGAIFAIRHHQVVEPLAVERFISVGVQGQDVGMIEPGNRPSLALEEAGSIVGTFRSG